MISILFVDDEPNILSGLQRMLRAMRHEWKMFFVTGGTEALAFMEENPVEVVVSDMKMPGMDGAALLQEVSRRYPEVTRIILSGYSEKEMIMKSIGTAHQYLSKPCDPETLKETIERASALQGLLANDGLRRRISQMSSVPSLPKLYMELMEEMERAEPNSHRIEEIISGDIGMAVKILQIVNSAFFGLNQHISDISRAINFLGFDTIRALALGAGVFSRIEASNPSNPALKAIWEHSVKVGATARQIAHLENPETANDSFAAGLLHDIGKVVLAVSLPSEFKEAERLAEEEGMPQAEAERLCFQATHSEVGAYLVGLWGLPRQVVEAVAFHKAPSIFKSSGFSPLAAVHVANIFHHPHGPEIWEEADKYFDIPYLARLGLAHKLPAWRDELLKPFAIH